MVQESLFQAATIVNIQTGVVQLQYLSTPCSIHIQIVHHQTNTSAVWQANLHTEGRPKVSRLRPSRFGHLVCRSHRKDHDMSIMAKILQEADLYTLCINLDTQLTGTACQSSMQYRSSSEACSA